MEKMMEDMSALRYEFMIRRAFDCRRGKKGADADIFRRLQELEVYTKNDPLDVKAQRQYQKQLEEVRDYSSNAVEKVISKASKKKNANNDKITELQNHNNDLMMATNSKGVANAISAISTSFNDLKIGTD